jgi:hypothetical protein
MSELGSISGVGRGMGFANKDPATPIIVTTTAESFLAFI